MLEKQITINFKEFNSTKELEKQDAELFNRAVDASQKAYAPYSNYKVGAAIELETGQIVLGNNQENAAYPSGLCAERVALFSTSANFPLQTIKRVAIAATNTKGLIVPATPCGACRQVMSEYEELSEKPIKIIFLNTNNKIIIVEGINTLLPFGFKFELNHLKV